MSWSKNLLSLLKVHLPLDCTQLEITKIYGSGYHLTFSYPHLDLSSTVSNVFMYMESVRILAGYQILNTTLERDGMYIHRLILQKSGSITLKKQTQLAQLNANTDNRYIPIVGRVIYSPPRRLNIVQLDFD